MAPVLTIRILLLVAAITLGACTGNLRPQLNTEARLSEARFSPRPEPTPLVVESSPHLTGRIRVAIDPSVGEAYLFADPETESYQGFEWDILVAIAEELTVDLQPVYIPWEQQLAALHNQQVDIVFGARTASGLESLHFLATQPYYQSPQRFVVRTDQADLPQHLSDLLGQKVGLVVNSTGAALLETYNQSRGNPIRLFATSNPDRLLEQLVSGKLDVILLDQPLVAQALRHGQEVKLSGAPLFPTALVGVVSARHPDLQQALNQALVTLNQTGKLRRILEEWLLWETSPSSTED